MDRRAAIVLGVIFGGLFLTLFAFLILAVSVVGGPERGGGFKKVWGSGNIGVVEISGPILESEDAVKELRRFAKEDRIKAVVLRVDSPGGAVAPSQEIYGEVKKLGESKPVVASFGNIAASGGYYVSAPATRIVANAGTLTGSIGVITQTLNISEIADKVGVQMNVVKSGPAKDLGNPFRPFSETDREVFQNLIDDVYRQFVNAVAEGRGIPVEQVEEVADGSVFSGERAQAAGLVDELGSFQDAVALAASLAGIEGEPSLVYPQRSEELGFQRFFGGAARAMVRAVLSETREQLQGEAAGSRIQYRLPGY